MPLDRQRGLVCVVTDRRRLAPNATDTERRSALVEQARAAAKADVDLFHVRERDLADRELLTLVRRIVEAVQGSGMRVVVNDRPDIAIAAGASGVHLRADGVSVAAVRRLAPGLIVGQSVHSRDEVIAAAGEGADYVVFGTVFPTPSKPESHPVAGVEGLRAAAAGAGLPVLAIGGVGPANVGAVAEAGAAGVAAIGWFATTDERTMRAAVQSARPRFDTSPGLI